jgi:hypothetical protein
VAHNGGAEIPGGADADLGYDVDAYRAENGQEAGLKRGEDPAAVRVCELREDDIAGGVELDGERAVKGEGDAVELVGRGLSEQQCLKQTKTVNAANLGL